MSVAISHSHFGLEPEVSTQARTVAIVSSKPGFFAASLANELRRLQPGWHWKLLDHPESAGVAAAPAEGTSYVYLPALATRDGMVPDLREAQLVFESAASHPGCHFVLLSSALVYGTGPGRTGFVTEDQPPCRNGGDRVSQTWSSLESLAYRYLDKTALTILRPTTVLGSPTLFCRLFEHRFVPSLPGHDPVLQLLSLSDLASAVLCVIKADQPGIFNVAPDDVVPLHAAIRLRRGIRVPIPRTLRRAVTRPATLDYLRYPWTVGNAKIKEQLGFTPRQTSAGALLEFCNRAPDSAEPELRFDEFGMDKKYIRFYGNSLFRLVSDCYWRIESRGLEHIPGEGPGILVGMHRGFMPFDGVMALHTVVRKTGRFPRFLTHPALLKFPFLSNFMTKLGGVVACQQSADHVLANRELLGIFPEGIHGAFTRYREAYKLQAFGRDAFVKLALRHRAPIIPFVTVGSAEIFPIFGKIKSPRWTRYAGWPFIPITPTFPLLPLPLPSKWHTQFLSPVSVDQYPPGAAGDPAVVKALSREVRTKMQQAVDEMLSKRRSIFWGSIFERRKDEGQPLEV